MKQKNTSSDILEDTSSTTMGLQPPIVTIEAKDLVPGYLNKLFQKGAKVVLLKNDYRCGDLWTEIMKSPISEGMRAGSPSRAWDSSLFDMARNHESGEFLYGDMLRFNLTEYGHWARKVKVFPKEMSFQFETLPPYFVNNNECITYDEKVLQKCWSFMAEILESLVPKPIGNGFSYGLTIEILNYPKSQGDLMKVIDLLKDSSGRWARLGWTLDKYKGMAAGIFNVKFVRDCFAVAMMVPGIRDIVRWINDIFVKKQKDDIPDGCLIIGSDHVDASKYFTCLMGDRNNIRTQIYTGEHWLDIDLTPHSFAIFPSQKSSLKFGMSATRHRILIQEQQDAQRRCQDNVTLIFTFIDR